MQRLLAASAALANLIDRRLVRHAAFGGMKRAGSAIVGALALLLGLGSLAAGVGSPAQASPRPVDVAGVLSGGAGDGDWVRLSGHALPTWIETYDDEDGDGTQDPDETATEYAYIVAVDGQRRGIVVRSSLAPRQVLRIAATGTVVTDAAYVQTDVDILGDQLGRVTVQPSGYVDARTAVTGTPVALDPAAPLPAEGTVVRLDGAPIAQFIVICAAETQASGCGSAGIDGWDLVVLDATGAKGVVVYTGATTDAFPVTLDGLLSDAPGQMRGLEQLDDGSSIRDTGWDLPPALYLDQGAEPVGGSTYVGFGVVFAILGALLLLGRVAGPVRFTPEPATLEPQAVLAVGEGITGRATGTLILPGAGGVGAIDAPAALVRLPAMTDEGQGPDGSPAAGAPAPASTPPIMGTADEDAAVADTGVAGPSRPGEADATTVDASHVGLPSIPVAASAYEGAPATDAPAPATAPATADSPGPEPGPSVAPPSAATEVRPSVLLVRRLDGAEGLAVGLGETRSVEAGTIRRTFRRQPALRLTTAVGPLILAFDAREPRDAAIAELLDETGLTLGPAS